MKTIKARYNCGQWIWDCAVCNSGNRIMPGNPMGFCGGCYPDKFAKKEMVIDKVIVRGWDKEKRERAKRLAWLNDDVYKITFPKNHKLIEATVRCRLEEHQSWEVGETIKDLINENETHPDLIYLRLAKKKKEEVEERPHVEIPVLDDETSGRIF